jgi:hypothetical protein
MTTQRHRYGSHLGARLVALFLLALVVACGGAASRSPSPSPSASPTSSATSAGSFADLPFSFDLRDGWVFGSSQGMASYLAALEKTNPEYAR